MTTPSGPAMPGEVEAAIENYSVAAMRFALSCSDDNNEAANAARETLRAAILAALAKAADENRKWECPKCGLTMWAEHTNADGSLTCPTCDDLPAALAQRETGAYYLIEKPQPGGIYWFSAGGGHEFHEFKGGPTFWPVWFSSDVRHVIRFRSREEAERILHFIRSVWRGEEIVQCLLVTEHLDMSRALASPAPEEGTDA